MPGGRVRALSGPALDVYLLYEGVLTLWLRKNGPQRNCSACAYSWDQGLRTGGSRKLALEEELG